MGQTPNPQMPLFPNPSPTKGPLQIAARIGDYARTVVALVFWTVVTAAALAGGYIALRGILFCVRIALQAIGV